MAPGETTRTLYPTPDEVGGFYDRTGRHLTRFFGGSMHYGYWTGPDDDSTLEEASERFTDLMAEKLDAAGGRVLDLGCGTGEPAVRVARTTGAEVVGISVSAEDVRCATARAEAAGLADRVRFEVADAMAPPFPANSFDAVLALESMGHMPDRARVLAEIARMLRPGGRLAFCEAFRKATLSPRRSGPRGRCSTPGWAARRSSRSRTTLRWSAARAWSSTSSSTSASTSRTPRRT